MTENLDELRAEVVEHGVLDYDQAQELLDRVEAAEAALASQRGVVKTLAERNVELTKFKDAYSLQAQELETAEAAVQRVREVAHYSNNVHREAILEALDGGE